MGGGQARTGAGASASASAEVESSLNALCDGGGSGTSTVASLSKSLAPRETKSGSITLEQCLQAYVHEENLHVDESLNCPRCR